MFHSLPGAIVDRAIHWLLCLIGFDTLNALIPSVITMAVYNVQQHISVPQSLKIIKGLLQAYHPDGSSRGWFSRDSGKSLAKTIESVSAKYNLIELLLQDLVFFSQTYMLPVFHEHGREEPSNSIATITNHSLLGRNRSSSRVDEVAVTGSPYSLIEHVRARLDFLEFILVHSPVTVDQSQISILWDCLVTNSPSFTVSFFFFFNILILYNNNN